ncbi:MAG: hypothetical protein HPY53_11170 [Brevinematales bacterium]|nr:hypothetical protein [Brevinematales bacterium]
MSKKVVTLENFISDLEKIKNQYGGKIKVFGETLEKGSIVGKKVEIRVNLKSYKRGKDEVLKDDPSVWIVNRNIDHEKIALKDGKEKQSISGASPILRF